MTAAKLSGALLVTAAGAAAGLRKKCELRRRAALLSALVTALGLMEQELAALQTPLPELFRTLARDGPEETRGFFSAVAAMTGQVPISALWREQANALPLGEQAVKTLAALGMSLGRCDADRQAAEIALTRRRMDALLQQEREELRVHGRTYTGLGLSLGAMLAIILF